MLEFCAVLAIGGVAWWWWRARRVREERTLFFAAAELRTLVNDYPHAEPSELVRLLALRLVAFRQDLAPRHAEKIAWEAAQHVAAGSEAWSPALPALPALPKPQPVPKSADPSIQTFWTIVGVGVALFAGLLLLGLLGR